MYRIISVMGVFNCSQYPRDIVFRDMKDYPGRKPREKRPGVLEKMVVVIAAEKEGKRIGWIRLVRVPDAPAECLEEAIGYSY